MSRRQQAATPYQSALQFLKPRQAYEGARKMHPAKGPFTHSKLLSQTLRREDEQVRKRMGWKMFKLQQAANEAKRLKKPARLETPLSAARQADLEQQRERARVRQQREQFERWRHGEKGKLEEFRMFGPSKTELPRPEHTFIGVC